MQVVDIMGFGTRTLQLFHAALHITVDTNSSIEK